MKKTTLITVLLATALSSFGQGTINFNNRVLGTLIAPIYGVDASTLANQTTQKSGNTASGLPVGTQTYGGALLDGAGFTASLWARPAGSSGLYDQVATGLFRSVTPTDLRGFWTNSTATVPTVAPGMQAQFVVRVWNNNNGAVASWVQALALFRDHGESAAFTPSGLGGIDVDGNIVIPPNMSGFRSFNLIAVPEPSLIALGALGFGALLLRRRKA